MFNFQIFDASLRGGGESTVVEKLEEMRKYLLCNSESIQKSCFEKPNADEIDAQSKIIASMLPDEVLHNSNDYEPRNFETAIILADISGQ